MKNTYLIAGVILAAALIALVLFTSPTGTGDTAHTTPVSGFSHAHGMATHPSEVGVVYIAAHDGLYELRGDAELFRVGNSRDDLMGFTAHPTEAGVFFSSGHPAAGGNIGFQKSTDGGRSWQRISPGLGGPVDFHAMTVSPANPNIVYGFFAGKLERSEDGGQTWEYAGGVVHPISLTAHPLREDVLYAATQNGVQVSENSGDSWKSLSPELDGGAVSVIAFHPKDESYALVFSERLGGLGRSTDGGVSWQRVAEDFGGGAVLYLAFSSVEPEGVYALTSAGMLYKSVDRGNTWNKLH